MPASGLAVVSQTSLISGVGYRLRAIGIAHMQVPGTGAPQIVFAPDDPTLVYAEGGCFVGISHDAGQSWTDLTLPTGSTMWHIAVAPLEHPVGVAVRRVYALGTTGAGGIVHGQLLYSTNGGSRWTVDAGLSVLT